MCECTIDKLKKIVKDFEKNHNIKIVHPEHIADYRQAVNNILLPNLKKELKRGCHSTCLQRKELKNIKTSI